MANALTANESALLASYEKTIENGVRSFVEVGEALLNIRDSRLYRETHKTFEAYCADRWSLTVRNAYQLIEAAGVYDDVNQGTQKPANEKQARPLTSVPKESRAEVWQYALDTAPTDDEGNPKVTGSHVEKAVKEWKEEKKPKPEKSEGPSLPDTSAFDDLAESIKALVADASALSKSDAGKFLNIKRVRALASDIKKLLKEARPVAICPYCEGRRCQMCARSGAVTEEMVSNFEPEGK